MAHTQATYLIGMMSGTSCDGIDVAIIDANSHQLNDFSSYPMPAELHEPILRLASPGLNEIDTLGSLDRALGLAFAEAANSAIKHSNIAKEHILAIGNHGQTIRHRPHYSGNHPFTLQIGCAATLAEQTGLTVISDFRSRDIAAGGEGAPLVPFAHQLLFGQQHQPTAILNLGGIANITMLNPDGSIQGFDTGPANMVMDALMLELTDGRHAYDQHGELAASGKICSALLASLMQETFILKAPPKSTGRETFGQAVVDCIMAWPHISDADRLATACALTVQSIIANIPHLRCKPEQWFACGGGAKNKHLMHSLEQALAPATFQATDDLGIPSASVEAISFALLAKYTLLGKANTMAQVTGASHDVCGGQITLGDNWPQVVQWIQQNNR